VTPPASPPPRLAELIWDPPPTTHPAGPDVDVAGPPAGAEAVRLGVDAVEFGRAPAAEDEPAAGLGRDRPTVAQPLRVRVDLGPAEDQEGPGLDPHVPGPAAGRTRAAGSGRQRGQRGLGVDPGRAGQPRSVDQDPAGRHRHRPAAAGRVGVGRDLAATGQREQAGGPDVDAPGVAARDPARGAIRGRAGRVGAEAGEGRRTAAVDAEAAGRDRHVGPAAGPFRIGPDGRPGEDIDGPARPHVHPPGRPTPAGSRGGGAATAVGGDSECGGSARCAAPRAAAAAAAGPVEPDGPGFHPDRPGGATGQRVGRDGRPGGVQRAPQADVDAGPLAAAGRPGRQGRICQDEVAAADEDEAAGRPVGVDGRPAGQHDVREPGDGTGVQRPAGAGGHGHLAGRADGDQLGRAARRPQPAGAADLARHDRQPRAWRDGQRRPVHYDAGRGPRPGETEGRGGGRRQHVLTGRTARPAGGELPAPAKTDDVGCGDDERPLHVQGRARAEHDPRRVDQVEVGGRDCAADRPVDAAGQPAGDAGQYVPGARRAGERGGLAPRQVELAEAVEQVAAPLLAEARGHAGVRAGQVPGRPEGAVG